MKSEKNPAAKVPGKGKVTDFEMSKEFIEVLFEAAHIQRWNDHIRPNGFTELDKQAHKMMIVYVLARYEEEVRDAKLDWRALIEGGLVEFLHRIVLTDIKPPVFHQLMERNGHELNRWVYSQLRERIPGLSEEFLDMMRCHLDDPTYKPLEKKILRAAHYLASQWEFNIIYPFNKGIYGIEQTKEAIANEIEDHYELIGVQKLALQGKTSKFIDLVGQLRFQKRWSQSPRVPETSVMGHVLIVAILSYFCSLNLGASEERIVRNYLNGLFHDLPEVLTRDIISPVKSSIDGLGDLIKEIEEQQLEAKILPLLPFRWHADIKYFTQKEFDNRCVVYRNLEEEDQRDEDFLGVRKVDDTIWALHRQIFASEEELDAYVKAHEKDELPPEKIVDGQVLKGCDHLAAFVEAWLSMQYGITSKHLQNGLVDLRKRYTGDGEFRKIGPVDFERIFRQFEAPERRDNL